MATHLNKILPCERLEGFYLKGERYSKEWLVKDKVKRSPESTGGNFSVGYHVENKDGTVGFLKATDIGFLSASPDMSALDKTVQVMTEQQFERTILNICNGNNMDRIIHALDYGDFHTTFDGTHDVVFFIIFELAAGDVRSQAIKSHREDFSWILNALHNLSVAVQQLHSAQISHNDIKPSNLLVFDRHLQKLADVGRATSDLTIGPWDGLSYCGDRTYVAPEFWYHNDFPNTGGKISFDVRRASDLYLLGSMAYFFVTGQALTPILQTDIRPEHQPAQWIGSYADVLPFVRSSFVSVMSYFEDELPKDNVGRVLREAEQLKTAVIQLCDPDPTSRGYPINIGGNAVQYSVERYVSLFDRLSKSARIRAKL